MKKILVTGSKGMLGQDLCPTLADNGYETIETDKNNLDITNFDMAEKIISKEKPNYLIHCAAYTDVDKAEEDIESARVINAKGTENLAKICAKYDIPIMYISTDYVFDGEKNSPYKPNDIPNPINNYGLTKFEGEKAIKNHCKKYFIIRTSWLYGFHGKNFVETMISLKDNRELKVVDDQIGCPTWTIELCDGIIKIIEEENYGIFHVCGSGEVSRFGFAKEIFKQMKINTNLIPVKSIEYPTPAKRPKYSVLDNNGLCRNWKLALRDYLNLRF